MYQMYMPIAKLLYQEINIKRDNGKFNNSNNELDLEYYEDFMFYAFSTFETQQTVGFEKKANIGFALIECLKEIDFNLANKLEKLLDKKYSKYTNLSEDLCQKFFHYGKDHLINIVEMVDKYTNSLENDKSIFPQKILDVIPTIKEIIKEDKHPIEKITQFSNDLSNSEVKLTSLCDAIEETMKRLFVHNLNKQTQQTVQEIKNNPSKLKRMNGQDFNLIIHSSLTPEAFLNNTGQEYHNMLSTSLIEDGNVRCYQSSNVKFAFYQNIDSESLISAFSGDANTDFTERGVLSSFSTPDYMSINAFKNKTHQGEGLRAYSEIMLKGDVRPNAIVCYDYLTEREYKLAEKHNLDIILVETKKYPNMLVPKDMTDPNLIKKVYLSIFEKGISR